ncbi:MAG: hypothetical protein ACK4YT_13590, partial [Sphingomonas sp.]
NPSLAIGKGCPDLSASLKEIVRAKLIRKIVKDGPGIREPNHGSASAPPGWPELAERYGFGASLHGPKLPRFPDQ